eukprot:TRINITY_DN18811_c0_g1_i1.p1 TRINITY_DN18811_c0_g1~~TRINITY_DN18811_c0_g1_i1.p1  ORF type:complete len:843 (+),score=286.30 TRINITY_DN18811_c0_g1_i1:119-2530(+)
MSVQIPTPPGMRPPAGGAARRRPQSAGRKRPEHSAAPAAADGAAEGGAYSAMREQQLLQQAHQKDEQVSKLKAEIVDLRHAQQQQLEQQTGQQTPGAAAGSSPGAGPEVEPATEDPGDSYEDVADGAQSGSPQGSARRRRDWRVLHEEFTIAMCAPPIGAVTPFAMESHTVSACGGKHYLVGGTSGSHLNADTWAYSVQQRRWRKLRASGNPPLGRYGHAAAVHRGKIYIYGGYGLGGITSREAAPQDHGALRAQAKSVTDPSLWQNADQGYQMIRCGLLNSLFVLDIESMVWKELQTPDREYLKNHSAVVHRGRIYYFGGCLLEGRTNIVRVFDCETTRWLPCEYYNSQVRSAAHGTEETSSEVPTVRSGHSAGLHTGDGSAQMVIFGGRMSKCAYCNDTFTYHFDTRQWERLYCGGELPPPRSAHSGTVWRGSLVVFGGYSHDDTDPQAKDRKQYFSDCYVLDLGSFMWREVVLNTMPPHSRGPRGRCGHSCALYEDADRGIMMVIFGGWGDVPLDSRHLADEDTHYQPDAGAAYATNNETWLVSIAPPAPPPAQQPARSQKPHPVPVPPAGSAQRRRPMTAPVTGRPGQRGRSSKIGSPSASPRPWCVTTSKATTAREFGDVPVPAVFQPKRDYAPQDVDRIIERLADTTGRDRQRQELVKRYINPPGAPVTPKMTKKQQSKFVKRHYHQVPELQAHLRRQLEAKYTRSDEPARLQGDQIEEMVERLHRMHATPQPPARDSNIVSKEKVGAIVDRLFTQGVRDSQEKQKQLREKYCPAGQGMRVARQHIDQIIGRLYTGK